MEKLFKLFGVGLLLTLIPIGPAVAQASAPQETYIKLPRTVPYVEQSTDSTCWLACATMIFRYYGQDIDEKALSERVYKISMFDRLKKKASGTLRGNERACLIALSQTEGLFEYAVNQAPKAVHDTSTMVTNSADTIRKTFSSLTNGSESTSASSLTSATNVNLESAIWNLKSANFDLKKYAMAINYLHETSKSRLPETLVAVLANATPAVIICNAGRSDHSEQNRHARVVTGIRIAAAQSTDVTNFDQIISVDVLDPARGAGSEIQVVSGSELETNLTAVYTREIAIKYLDMERQSLGLTNRTTQPSIFKSPAIPSFIHNMF